MWPECHMQEFQQMSKIVGCLRRFNVCGNSERRISVGTRPLFYTPCSSGSPLKYLTDSSEPSASDLEWFSIMQSVEGYLVLGDSKSFELPVRNNIWKRPEAQRVLERNGLEHFSDVSLCQTGMCNQAGEPIGKKLRFFSTSACFSNYLTNKFGVCACLNLKHADFNTVVWKETGYYNKNLAKAILAAARASRRDP